jgi:putative copper resistance protein D
MRIATDMLHLLAAGAWLGALPGLVLLLSTAHRSGAASAIDAAARATRRFSTLGVLSVSILIATGTANAVYLVRSFAALIGSEYGQFVLAKLALVAAMLALAVVNRWRLSPRIAAGDRGSVGALARNAALETLAGIGVVAIVGVLGITVPGMHSMHHQLHSGTSGAIISHPSSHQHHG